MLYLLMISSRESDVKIAMNRASPTVIALLSLFLVAAARDNSTHNSVNVIVPLTTGRDSEAASDAQACSRSTLCCRLGRKAVRLSYPAMYTCKIEALAQGLEYHTSASHRLKLMPPKTDQADRMDAANTLHMSFGFRKRLMLCESKGRVQKQCFEYCCERKLREEQAKARRINHRQDRQDP